MVSGGGASTQGIHLTQWAGPIPQVILVAAPFENEPPHPANTRSSSNLRATAPDSNVLIATW